MKEAFLCDFSTHYAMGDSYAMVRFTPKELEHFLTLKLTAETDEDAYDEMEELIESIEKKHNVNLYGVSCTPYSELFGKKTPKRIISILKQGKAVSNEWEEGSFAIATTEKRAQDAVRKIEAKHVSDGWF